MNTNPNYSGACATHRGFLFASHPAGLSLSWCKNLALLEVRVSGSPSQNPQVSPGDPLEALTSSTPLFSNWLALLKPLNKY